MSNDTISTELKQKLCAPRYRPAIITWNRLEGRPRREDFDRSLRAEIRDPLWMLCRQWQLGEFKHEDAGSAIKAKVQLATTRINRYASGRNGKAVSYDASIPLEAQAEREPVHLDLMTRAQVGRHWFKLLETVGDFRDEYLDQYSFEEPKDSDDPEEKERRAQLHSDPRSWQTFTALKDRVVDGEKLLKDIRSETNEHVNWLMALNFDEEKRNGILEVAQEFVKWFDRVYSQPGDEEDSAWADSYLEYQFACSAPADEAGGKEIALVAEQYRGGHLDWYSFDVDEHPKLSGLEQDPISFIPNPIEFGGMPNLRWWEFEDHKTDLGNLNASTSDLATLMLAEFGLIFGNDWSVVPYDLEVGSLCEVLGIVVTDVFGVRTLIGPAADWNGEERESWGMYYLSTANGGFDTRLFVPPVTPRMLESKPIERVILARDEMANMVWAIEQTIPCLASGGVDGFEAAADLERYFLSQDDTASPPDATDLVDTGAKIRYVLGTRVPENWIPFIAVHNPGSNREIRLQRGAMPRLIPGTEDDPAKPRGSVLRPGLDEDQLKPYFIHEEEVPRAGAVVTRTYQRTRWWDGKVCTWLGRRKQTGRGQGSSGLEFDRIAPVE